MKNITNGIIAVALILTFSLPLTAKDLSKTSKVTPVQFSQSRIVDNLLQGIKSGNNGLKLSSLYLMGDYDTEKSVIELMRTLKDDPKDEARITAALSLFKLGDARGLYAVKRAAEFDDSPRVRKMCENYYRQFLAAKI